MNKVDPPICIFKYIHAPFQEEVKLLSQINGYGPPECCKKNNDCLRQPDHTSILDDGMP